MFVAKIKKTRRAPISTDSSGHTREISLLLKNSNNGIVSIGFQINCNIHFIYKFLNVCPFDYTAVAGSGKVGPVNHVNHTNWVAVVTSSDRPK